MRFKPSFVVLPLFLSAMFAFGCSSKESPLPDTAPDTVSRESVPTAAQPDPVQGELLVPEEVFVAPADEPSPVAEEPKEKWGDQPALFRSLGNALGRGFQNAINNKKESIAEENSDAEEKDVEEKGDTE